MPSVFQVFHVFQEFSVAEHGPTWALRDEAKGPMRRADTDCTAKITGQWSCVRLADPLAGPPFLDLFCKPFLPDFEAEEDEVKEVVEGARRVDHC